MLKCIYAWVSNAIQSLWTLFMYIYLDPSNQKYSINSYMYIMQVHVHVCKMFHSILYMYSVCTLTSSNLEVIKKWETVWILAQVYEIFIYNRIKIVFQINTCTCKVNSKCFLQFKTLNYCSSLSLLLLKHSPDFILVSRISSSPGSFMGPILRVGHH